MLKFLPKKRSTRILFLFWTAVGLVVMATLGYHYVAKPGYKNWREKRANSIAREHLAKGEYPAALAAARKAIQYNRSNIDAWRLAVEITEKQESPQAFVFQQGLADLEPTLENKLRYIRTAVKFRAYPQALEAINKVGPEAADSVEFYELASQVSQVMRNPTKAKYYLMSLVKLRPDDNKARLDLAQIRLVDGFEDNKPSIRAEIRSLANDPALRTRAHTLLLSDALQEKNATEALEIAGQLGTTPDLPSGTQLLIAEAYRQFSPKRFTTHLEKLKTDYAEKPELVPGLVNYLGSNELYAEARQWLEGLPAKTRDEENVQMSYSAVLLSLGEFTALDTYLRPLRWTDNEFARQALLAYSARKRGDERAFGEAWKLAVIECGSNPLRIQSLLARVTAWGWPEQRVELLWKKFALDPSDKTTRQLISAWERRRQNTAALNRLFGRINENDPADRDAKNNYAYTSLLLGTSLDRAHTDARANYEADPKNPFFATTYAFSLYRQGKAQNALQVLETLTLGSLAAPERTLLHGVLLIANGRADEGLDQTAHLKLDQFLPEERRLYEDAAALAARSRRDQDTAARLAAFAGSSAGGAARKSWLQALPASYRSADVQMELADSLYATDDFRSLENTLKNEKWADHDFLRLTLLAYAQKNLGREAEALATWRIVTSAAANNAAHLGVLEEICERWGWSTERIDILNRILQRDPNAANAMADLTEHYRKNGLTSELARIYALRVDGDAASNEDKSHFAYFNLLANTNTTKANILAKQAYDQAPGTVFNAKAFAFSLLKQQRYSDAWRTLENILVVSDSGPAQLALLRAAITLEQGKTDEAKKHLQAFDPSSALPEEIALANTLSQTLAAKKT